MEYENEITDLKQENPDAQAFTLDEISNGFECESRRYMHLLEI